MRLFIAILIGKLISLITKTLQIGGGSAAPGYYALKIDPDLVEKLAKKIPKNIIITGTNGKTTTSRMVAHFATQSGLKVIRNHTGSNLERGIASTLITNYQLQTTNYQLGIWELDEAAFNSVGPKLKPDMVIFLNIFRDQLDRYGEIDSVVKRWCDTLKNLDKNTKVLINGDDTNLEKLATSFKGKVEHFGVENYKITGESLERRKNPTRLDFEAKNIKLDGLKGSSFTLTTNYQLPLPGIYHIYDAVAALACATHLGLPASQLADSLSSFSPAFGRVEKFTTPTSEVGYIFLIKNPAGATQVFETLALQLKKSDRLLVSLNDNLADGTDVSWIWDAEFEQLTIENGQLKIICSGTRAADLAVRLKYAGFNPKSITVEPNLEKAFKEAQKGLEGRLFILPTYTAMLELQGILAKQGIKKHYWQDN